MARIAILGAGPAGLMTARELQLAGHECTVLEAASHVGGMAASIEIDGQRVDLGSHRLHPATDAEDLALLRQLLGADLQVRERNGRIHLGETWLGFPLQMGDMARALPRSFAVGAAYDSVRNLVRRPDNRSFASRVDSTLGPTVARWFYTPYAVKLYGRDPSHIDAELARRRISARGASDIIRRLFSARTEAGRTFLYPRNGYGQLCEALADDIVEQGAELRLDSRVDHVRCDATTVDVHADGAADRFDHVISTIPVDRLASMLTPAPPEAVMAALSDQETRAMVLVYLTLPVAQYTPWDAHYLPDADRRVARVSEPKNYRDNPDDPDQQTVLCAELACWVDDDLWSATDEELGRLVCEELDAVGLPSLQPAGVATVRLPSVYPIFAKAGAPGRAVIDQWAVTDDRLTVLGRQGLMVPDNLHHVIRMARAARDAMRPDGRRDHSRWRAALDAFHDHVVED